MTNKIFLGVTIFLVALIGVVMFFPRAAEALGGGEDGETEGSPEAGGRPVMLLSVPSGEAGSLMGEAFAAAFGRYNVRVLEDSLEEMEAQILDGTAECALVVESLNAYDYYVNNLSMYDRNTETADEVLKQLGQMQAMVDGGLSWEEAEGILSSRVSHEVFSLGKDQIENFFYTYIMIFALYMVILLYGQMVASNVATEKSSRAMEVLITSARPVSMMFGKVLASCLAGFTQLVAVFGSAVLFFNLNKEYWGGTAAVASVFDMPPELLGYMLVFFVLGFLIYAFLYGAIGSTASKLEDINTSVMPITMLFIVAFMVVMYSLADGNVDNILMKICSFVPFTSPMAMFTRIAMSSVPFHEVLISVAILVVSVFGVGVLAARIYKVGVLLYGTTPKLGSILKAIRKE